MDNTGWSGGAMVLGKLPVPGRPKIWIRVGQGPTALVVGAGGGCLDILLSSILFSPHSPSLWETARYRLKYCLKGPLNPKQQQQWIIQNAQYLVSVLNPQSSKQNLQNLTLKVPSKICSRQHFIFLLLYF